MKSRIKKIMVILSSVILVTNVMAADKENSLNQVLISQVVEHPALDATTKGIIDGLEKNGFKRGINLTVRVESAQANVALASQIAAKFINQNPDVVVGVGTLSAQSFVKYAQENKVKLIFSSVTDPVGASLVKSLNTPGNNISGVSNFVDLEPQLELFKKLQPDLKNLGVLYNPGEINSISIIKKLEILCPKLGITLVKQTANKTADVAQTATKLASRVEAIFISNDNTALGALQSIVRAANKAKVPVYVSDTDAVKLGALAALGPNQYQIGLQTGKMIARTLNGESISKMPVEFPNKTDLYINLEAAKITSTMIPKDIKAQAIQIIQ